MKKDGLNDKFIGLLFKDNRYLRQMKISILSSLLFLTTLFFFPQEGNTQSYFFGAKIGPTVAFQQWNNFERDPLFSYHFAAFVETYSEEGSTSSLYAQLGYHNRGSAIRVFDFFNSINLNQTFEFRNVSLQFGGKRVLLPDNNWQPYYNLGVRLEYTVGTNLAQYERFASPFYPLDVFVNKLNYGVTIGGGFQKYISPKLDMAVEFNISPDLSLQYEQEAIPNVINPFNPGQATTLQERSVRNLSLEISVVFRFLREIIYID